MPPATQEKKAPQQSATTQPPFPFSDPLLYHYFPRLRDDPPGTRMTPTEAARKFATQIFSYP